MARKPHFAYVTAVDISRETGAGINEREFVEELSRNYRDEVTCVVPAPAFPDVYRNPSVEYVRNHDRHRPLPYALHLLSCFGRLVSLHRRHRLSAIACRLDILPVDLLAISYVLRVPLILKSLQGIGIFSETAQSKFRLVARAALPLFKLATARAIAADTPSVPYMDWLACTYGMAKRKLEFIPNGANVHHFQPTQDGSEKERLGFGGFDTVIGYVGSVDMYRNVELLVRSFATIAEAYNAVLVVIGGGAGRLHIETLVGELGIAQRVIFIGVIPYATVPEYMRAFDFAVDPTSVPMTHNDTTVHGSYSQKIAQYLAGGLPVVAWRVEDNLFLEEKGLGALADLDDEKSLTQALVRLSARSPEVKIEQRQVCRAYAVEHLSAAAITKRRVEFWGKAVAPTGRGEDC